MADGRGIGSTEQYTVGEKFRQRKIEAKEEDKVEVPPGVTVASLRWFRAALIGPTRGLP